MPTIEAPAGADLYAAALAGAAVAVYRPPLAAKGPDLASICENLTKWRNDAILARVPAIAGTLPPKVMHATREGDGAPDVG